MEMGIIYICICIGIVGVYMLSFYEYKIMSIDTIITCNNNVGDRYRSSSSTRDWVLLPTRTNPEAEISGHVLHRCVRHPDDISHPQNIFLDHQRLCHKLAVPSHVHHHHPSTYSHHTGYATQLMHSVVPITQGSRRVGAILEVEYFRPIQYISAHSQSSFY